MWEAGLQSLDPLNFSGPRWEKLTGIKIKVIEVPTAEMLMDGRIDAVMAYYHHNIVNRSEGRNFEAVVTLGVTPGAKVLVANHARDKYKSASRTNA